MSRASALVAACLLAAVASPGLAQTPAAGTVFIGASGFASVEKVAATGGFGVPGADDGATVAAGGLGVGIHLTPSVSARLEWSVTDTLKTSSPLDVTPLGSLTYLAVPGGEVLQPATLPFVVEQRFERRRQSKAVLALLGYRLGGDRLALELLGGLGVVYVDTRESYDVRILQGSVVTAAEFRTAAYRSVAAIGADLPVVLAGHASIVPSVRAWAVDGGLTVRTGLGLRWTF